MICNYFKFPIAAVAVMMASSAVNAQTTFMVDSLDNFGAGTLREAITMANATPAADTILFSVAGTINLNSQLPSVTEALTIDGGGEITIDAGNGIDNVFGTGDGFRVFNIDDGSSGSVTPLVVDLIGLTITGGDAARDAAADGGGIRNREELTLTNVHVTGNSAGDGGTMFSVGGNGGGIFNLGGILTLIDSSVTGNRSGNGGTGTNGDSVGGEGGGIMSTFNNAIPAGLALVRSTVSGNTTGFGGDQGNGPEDGGRGGGIFSVSNIILVDSTISGNTTQGNNADGGGIAHIAIGSPPLRITNCTITNNVSSDTAGAIYTRNDPIVLENSIVAGNMAANGDIDITLFDGGSVIANFSMIEQDDLLIGGTGNMIGMAPNLGPLADNGGLTQTHALLPGSPAIDAGDPSIVFDANEFDQRGEGFPRVVGASHRFGLLRVVRCLRSGRCKLRWIG